MDGNARTRRARESEASSGAGGTRSLESDVAAAEACAARAARTANDHYRQSVSEVDNIAAEMTAALSKMKITVGKARRVQAAERCGGVGAVAGIRQPVPQMQAAEGVAALDETAGVLAELEGNRNTVSAELLECAAGAMVMSWLKTVVGGRSMTQSQLARLANRVQHAFRQAAYQPHEWLMTLESMGPPELAEFMAAIETSPVPGEVSGAPKQSTSRPIDTSARRQRGGSMARSRVARQRVAGRNPFG